MNKYEQLIEHIINDETDKARELFHNIVVEKSRDIYESLVDESDLEEVGGNPVKGCMDEVMDEVELDEQGITEEEDEFGADDEMENDFDHNGELDAHEEEHGDVETRVDDLESALDELKAEFDALMAGEESEEEHADMFGDEEAGEEAGEFDSEEAGDEFGGEMVREYVEKVAAPSNTAVKVTSPVAKKNDMGGSAKNIAQGDTGADVTAEKAQKMNTKNINVPGGKAGNAFSNKEKVATTESRKSK